MAIGIVVDDAITDVHQIAERLRAGTEDGAGTPAWRKVLEASLAVRSSLLFATFIVVAAVVPGFFLEGQAGSFLPPVLVSYLLAIAASMVVALVLTPGLGLMLLSRSSEPRESPVLRWIGARHGVDRDEGDPAPSLVLRGDRCRVDRRPGDVPVPRSRPLRPTQGGRPARAVGRCAGDTPSRR